MIVKRIGDTLVLLKCAERTAKKEKRSCMSYLSCTIVEHVAIETTSSLRRKSEEYTLLRCWNNVVSPDLLLMYSTSINLTRCRKSRLSQPSWIFCGIMQGPRASCVLISSAQNPFTGSIKGSISTAMVGQNMSSTAARNSAFLIPGLHSPLSFISPCSPVPAHRMTRQCHQHSVRPYSL